MTTFWDRFLTDDVQTLCIRGAIEEWYLMPSAQYKLSFGFLGSNPNGAIFQSENLYSLVKLAEEYSKSRWAHPGDIVTFARRGEISRSRSTELNDRGRQVVDNFVNQFPTRLESLAWTQHFEVVVEGDIEAIDMMLPNLDFPTWEGQRTSPMWEPNSLVQGTKISYPYERIYTTYPALADALYDQFIFRKLDRPLERDLRFSPFNIELNGFEPKTKTP